MIKVKLDIIEHEVDKDFPKTAVLRLDFGDKIYQEAINLDLIYKEGDTGLKPHHLSELFIKIGKQLKIKTIYETTKQAPDWS